MPFVSRKRFDWTPEAEAKLWGLFGYGLPAREVAEQMGLSVAAVEKRYIKLKQQKEQNNGKDKN